MLLQLFPNHTKFRKFLNIDQPGGSDTRINKSESEKKEEKPSFLSRLNLKNLWTRVDNSVTENLNKFAKASQKFGADFNYVALNVVPNAHSYDSTANDFIPNPLANRFAKYKSRTSDFEVFGNIFDSNERRSEEVQNAKDRILESINQDPRSAGQKIGDFIRKNKVQLAGTVAFVGISAISPILIPIIGGVAALSFYGQATEERMNHVREIRASEKNTVSTQEE